MSLPLRKCGLKFWKALSDHWDDYVTSLAEVWIEISRFHWSGTEQVVTSLAEVWIEIVPGSVSKRACGHFPCGSVDWNSNWLSSSSMSYRHFPCGSVDWNLNSSVEIALSFVTSLAEVWIEIDLQSIRLFAPVVTSLAEVWIEISRKDGKDSGRRVTSLAEVWIEIYFISYWSFCKYCHFPCGSVDWNLLLWVHYMLQYGHFPCGSVDWNLHYNYNILKI